MYLYVVTVCYTPAQTCATNVKRRSNQNCSVIRNRNVPMAARQEQCSDGRIQKYDKEKTNMSISDATQYIRHSNFCRKTSNLNSQRYGMKCRGCRWGWWCGWSSARTSWKSSGLVVKRMSVFCGTTLGRALIKFLATLFLRRPVVKMRNEARRHQPGTDQVTRNSLPAFMVEQYAQQIVQEKEFAIPSEMRQQIHTFVYTISKTSNVFPSGQINSKTGRPGGAARTVSHTA